MLGAHFGINDIVQVGILYLGIYALIRLVRGTRNAPVLLGFCVLVVVLLSFIYLFRFDVLERIVYFLLALLALSMVVVFQQEIRRLLAVVGGQRFFARQYTRREASVADQLHQSVLHLSRAKIGALIAIERGIYLSSYEEAGVKLRALISHELLVSIFTPPLPLHDGGIILRDGQIAAAHCLFPVSNQLDLEASGMRHRAAVGLSEETDAVIIVVSEETGIISIAHNGRLRRYQEDKVERVLKRWILKAMPHKKDAPVTFSDWIMQQINKLLKPQIRDEKAFTR